MVVGVVDMSNAFGPSWCSSRRSQRSIEKVMQTTGRHDASTRPSSMKPRPAAGVPKSQVTLDFWLECDGVAARPTTILDECTARRQTEARYIVVSILDKYTPMFPVHFGGIDSDGTYHITATAGIRTR